jgi:hypothetical protein
LLQEFLSAHQILAGSRVLGEFAHTLTAIEFLDGSDDGFTLRLCLCESHSVCKIVIRNINGGLHESILPLRIFSVNRQRNTAGCVRPYRIDTGISTHYHCQNRSNDHVKALIRFITVALIIVAVPACISADAIVAGKLQTISSGHTGCEPADNVISDVHADAWGAGTWHATCHGKLFLCSGTDDGKSIGCATAP